MAAHDRRFELKEPQLGKSNTNTMVPRSLAAFATLSVLTIWALAAEPWNVKLTADEKSAVDRISSQSLKGNLSFLASDLLEGRNTPSRGLDVAAEYIAAQFRRAGLEPAGDDGYFQTTEWKSDPPQKVRNVVGILKGSDPRLKDTYILVTAHYDHLGIRTNMEGDNIFNGANDDGSGTVSVIELAYALGSLKPRPKRSIVFMTFYGEEKGMVGSRYYGAHPIFPIEKTIADINLEQIGRTDDTEGPRIAEASMTGYDFSDLGSLFSAAGKQVGIKVTKHARNSDAYFGRSDNQAMADQGVPSGTLCTAFAYPDYHRAGDHWEKADYENMAKIDRMVAIGLITLANSTIEPRWNKANPKTEKYVKAWEARRRG